MKPAPFAFARPDSLTEALETLAATPDAKVLAGGQSLVPLLSMRLAAPGTLIDINGLSDLAYVRSGDDGVRVGALARHADVERDRDAARVQPMLRAALRLVAHPTIRNRGTTVGSLVHADASAEMPMVLVLLEGSLTAASTAGQRTIEAADLYVGPLETALHHDEVAVEAFFPALAERTGVAIDEIARRHGDYALCGVAALVTLDGDLAVASVRAGYLSVADLPTVVDLTPALAGRPLDAAALDEATDLALADLEPLDDIHATAAYRRRLVRVLTHRVVGAAHADAVERTRG